MGWAGRPCWRRVRAIFPREEASEKPEQRWAQERAYEMKHLRRRTAPDHTGPGRKWDGSCGRARPEQQHDGIWLYRLTLLGEWRVSFPEARRQLSPGDKWPRVSSWVSQFSLARHSTQRLWCKKEGIYFGSQFQRFSPWLLGAVLSPWQHNARWLGALTKRSIVAASEQRRNGWSSIPLRTFPQWPNFPRLGPCSKPLYYFLLASQSGDQGFNTWPSNNIPNPNYSNAQTKDSTLLYPS